MQDSYNDIFGNKQRVMFVFAHPDDAEIYCGGTIARLKSEGKDVLLVKMTKGNKGSRQEHISETDLATTRENEDEIALGKLGLKLTDNINLDLGDGRVENNLATIEKLVEVIRKFKPDLVVTHNPKEILVREPEGSYYVNHRDHRNTATSVVDASYPYSRDILFFPDQIEKGLTSHTVTEYLFVDAWDAPDKVLIDVTNFMDQRISAIMSHKSQFDEEKAQSLNDFFALEKDGRRYEQFWKVVAD